MRVDHSPARIAAYNAQRGRCYYCANVMWERQLESKGSATHRVWRFHHPKQYEGIADSLADAVCTAEHLERQADGGDDRPSNIVAACRYCNSNRGDTSIAEWRTRMDCDQSVDRSIFWYHTLFLECSIERVRNWLAQQYAVDVQLSPRTSVLRFEGIAYAVRDDALIFPTPSQPQLIPGCRLMLEQPHGEQARAFFRSAVV